MEYSRKKLAQIGKAIFPTEIIYFLPFAALRSSQGDQSRGGGRRRDNRTVGSGRRGEGTNLRDDEWGRCFLVQAHTGNGWLYDLGRGAASIYACYGSSGAGG